MSENPPAKDHLTLPLDAFVRSISINRDTPHALFLGAGASLTSSLPSAEQCVRDWKGQIFASGNPDLGNQTGHIDLRSVQDRVQAWLDKQGGFPVAGSAEEYSQ